MKFFDKREREKKTCSCIVIVDKNQQDNYFRVLNMIVVPIAKLENIFCPTIDHVIRFRFLVMLRIKTMLVLKLFFIALKPQ